MKSKRKKSSARDAAWLDTVNRSSYFEERKDDIVERIQQLVEIESPSDNKQAADRLGTVLAEKFEALGGKTRFHRSATYGDHLQVDFAGRRGGNPVLLLGHFDTVYPLGTLANMPCQVSEGRLWGPGVLDMKSGIALMLPAFDVLRVSLSDLPHAITVLLVSAEEVERVSSGQVPETLAKRRWVV